LSVLIQNRRKEGGKKPENRKNKRTLSTWGRDRWPGGIEVRAKLRKIVRRGKKLDQGRAIRRDPEFENLKRTKGERGPKADDT